jgi:ABC-2 type transport system ATP-binding protein
MRLVVEKVGKQYQGGLWALRDFSLELAPGILGLLGPNGAGKSTLMRILATITRPTEGRVTWDGTDVHVHPDALRRVLGYLPQDFGVYPHLDAVEFLDYLGAVRGLDGPTRRARIPEVLAIVNLSDAKRRPLGGYSGGMRQRIGIAQALLHEPRLLIVDEPTVGLDPEERVRFRTLLADLAHDRIVILSTHIVSDLESTAERIALLDKGRLLDCATAEELVARTEGRVWEWTIAADALPALRQSHHVSGMIRRADGGVRVRVVADTPPAAGATPAVPTLEDAYLSRIATAAAGAA